MCKDDRFAKDKETRRKQIIKRLVRKHLKDAQANYKWHGAVKSVDVTGDIIFMVWK